MRIVRALWKIVSLCAIAAIPLASLPLFATDITLAWQANTESDVAGYKVWYNAGSGYLSIDVGNVTTAVVPNLPGGATCLFNLTAYNTSGLESAPSASVVYTIPSSGSAPLITKQPVNQTLVQGAALTLSLQVSSPETPSFQWFLNNLPVPDATGQSFQVASMQTSNGGRYSAKVWNSGGSVTSSVAIVIVISSPAITTQPLSQTISAGGPLALSVKVSNTSTVRYQWFHNAVSIQNATNATWQIASAQASDAGNYTVQVTNLAGTVSSAPATITVLTPTISAPSITAQPLSQTIIAGGPLSLTVSASGADPLRFQWYHNDVPISSATTGTLQISSVQSADAGSYTVSVANDGGTISSIPAVITVITPPSITQQPASQSLAVHGALNLFVQASGTSPLKYQWFRNGSALAFGTNSTLQIFSVATTDAGTYTVAVSNSAGSVTSSGAVVSVLTPPLITLQPASQSVRVGAPVTFLVQASGSGFVQYQWWHNGVAIPNATSETLQIPAVQASDAGSYTVNVSNEAGVVVSLTAILTVSSSPEITIQPVSQTVTVGSVLSLSVQASGTGPLQYQWLRNGVVIPAGTGAAFQIASVQSIDAASYAVKVSNASGTVTSDAAVVTVVSTPVIATQPTSQTVTVGSVLNLSVQASGTGPLQYQWSRNGAAIPGANGATFQIGSVQSGDAASYTVKVSNIAGSVLSDPAAVSVVSTPVITLQPASQTVTVGAVLNLMVQASGTGPLQYQWSRNGSPIPGATGASFQIGSAQSADTGSYTVQVSNLAGSAMSDSAVVTVVSSPVIVTQPLSQTVTVGSVLNLFVQASGTGPLQYQWLRDGAIIPGATAASFQIASVQIADSASYGVKVSNLAGTVMSDAALVTVVATPVLTTQPVSRTVTLGSVLNLAVQASGTGPLLYQWMRDGAIIPGATSATFQIASVQSTDAGTYAVRVSNVAGTVVSDGAIVSVVSTPVITAQPLGRTVTVGSTLNLTVQASGSGPLQYQWMQDGAVIPGAMSATFQIGSVQSSDAASYTVRISNPAGTVVSDPAVVSVVSTPVINVQPSSQTVTLGSTLNLSVQAAGSGPLQYQWLQNGVAIQNATSANFQIVSVQPGDAASYAVKVSNIAGTVVSAPAVVTVVSTPVISTQPLSQTVTVGSTLNLSVQASGSGTLQYQWLRDGTLIPDAVSATLQIAPVQSSDAASYVVKVSNVAGTVASAAAVVTVVTTPVITTQPLGQTVTVGSGLNLSVQASGTGPLQYQWLRDGAMISGATSATFQIASVQPSDAASYIVKVSNAAGTVVSDPAVVSVVSTPVISTQPVSRTITVGSTLNLTVQASGAGPLQYQWFRDGAIISGAISANFQIASAQSSDAASYIVKISNPVGTVVSDPAIVSVVSTPVIATQPLSRTIAVGSTLNLSVQASGGPLQYQWLRNGTLIPNETSASFQIASVQSSDAASYAVSVSNAAGTVVSDSAVITVVSTPVIMTQPLSRIVTLGATLNLSVEASGTGPLVYQWSRDGAPISDATNATFQIGSVQSADAASYVAKVSNLAGTVVSSAAVVTVVSTPVITAQPLAQTVTVGSTLNLSVQASGSGPLQYQWLRDGAIINGAVSANFQIGSVQLSDAGSYLVKVVNAAGTVVSDAAVVSVVSTPVITAQPLSRTITVGSALNLAVQASGTGPLQYQWMRDGVILPGASSAIFQIASVQSSDAASYNVKISNTAGTVTSDAAVVSVVSSPVIDTPPLGQTVTIGSTLNLSVRASATGPLQYQWLRNGAIIQNATNATLQIGSVQLSDAASYAVNVSNPAGTVASDAAVVTVVSTAVITAQPISRTVTVGATLNLSVQAGGTGPLEYQWQRDGAPISGATNAVFQIASVQLGDAAAYAVKVSNAAGTVISDTALVIVVSTPVILVQPVSKTLTVGSVANLSVQALGTGPLQYQWMRDGVIISGATSATFQIASVQSSDAASYNVKVSNTAGTVVSAPAVVTVVSTPVIVTQPFSRTVTVGSTLNISVQASGLGPLQYQWVRNGVAIPSATAATYQVASVQPSDAASYVVNVSNTAGTVVSDPAIVTVVSTPVITTQPQGQTVTVGSTLKLSVHASGTGPLQYQWLRDGAIISGATNAVLQVASVQSADAAGYGVKVSNAAGTVISETALVTVVSTPVISAQPASKTVTVGSVLNLSVQASGTGPLEYQWLRDGTIITGATSATFQIASVQSSDAASYNVKVSNSAGTVVSDSAIVGVVSTPVITTQPVSRIVAVGSPLTLSVQAAGSGPLYYQWLQDGAVMAGATNATFQIASAQLDDAASYTVKVSNSAGTVVSDAAVVSVVSTPVITTQPPSQTVPAGSPLNLTVQASGTGPLAYQWLRDGTAIPNATSATLQISSAQPSDAGSYLVQVSNSAGAVVSEPAVVSVVSSPVIITQPLSQTVAIGSSLNLSVQVSGSGSLQYQWLRNGVPISGATAASLQIASVQANDAASYTVIVSNSSGLIVSDVAVVNIVSTPVIAVQPLSQTLAVGSLLNLSVQADGSGSLQYQWLRNGTAISGATSTTFQIAAVQPTDAASYTVKVSNGAGTVVSDAAQVNVVSSPVIAGQPVSQTIAIGAPLNLSVQASGSGLLRYQWLRNGTVLSGAISATFQIASVQLSDAGSYTVIISNAAGLVVSDPVMVNIISAPTITAQPAGQTVPLGTPLTLLVQATSPAPMQYQWFHKGTPIPNATSASFQIEAVQLADAGSYAVRVSNAVGSTFSMGAIVSVSSAPVPPVILTQPQSQSVAIGSALHLSVQASGSAPMQYQWYRNGALVPNATNASFSISSVQTTDATVYGVQVSNAAGIALSAAAMVSVATAPVITTQPASQTVASGTTLIISVQASSTGPLQYQWSRNGQPISGATAATLQVSSVQMSDAGSYSVQVWNVAGTQTSSPALITIVAAPTFITQPASQTVAPGGFVNLLVNVTGSTPIQLQWFKNGVAIPGATGTIFQIASVQPGNVGSYTVAASNAAGTVTSLPATVTLVIPPLITVHPGSQTVPPGTALNLSVTASGSAPLQYQWFRNGIAIPNATNATLQITSVKTSDAGFYVVTVANSAGTATSAPASISLTSAPTITLQPIGQSLNVGYALTLSVGATGPGPIRYQWFRNGTPITGASSPTFSILSVQQTDAGSYAVSASNVGGTTTSVDALVLVANPPVITTQPLSQTVSVGTGLNLSVQATGGMPLIYQWFRNSTAIVGATSAKYQLASAAFTDSASYTVKISNADGSVLSSAANISVVSVPVIVSQPATQSIAVGSALNISVSATGPQPLQYQWFHNDLAIPGAVDALLQIASAQQSDAGTYIVEVSNAFGSTTSNPAAISVLIPPTAIVLPASQTINANSPFLLRGTVSGSAPLRCQWSRNGSILPGATNTTLQILLAQLSDAGTYTLTVSNAVGSGMSAPVTITVLAPPLITAPPLSQSVTEGALATFSVQATGSAPLAFQWFRNSTLMPGATSATLSFTATTNDAGIYQVMVSNPLGSVTSANATLAVTKKTGNSAADATVPANLSDHLTIELLGRSGLVLRAIGTPGNLYDIQSADDVATGQWSPVALIAADQSGAIEFTSTSANSAKVKFYRIITHQN